MRIALLSSSLLCGMSLCSAGATDLTIKGSLIQSIEANSNYQLVPKSPGFTFLPVTTLILDAIARTPTTRLEATVDLSYRDYFGPGADDLKAGLDRGFRGIFEKYANLTTYRIEGGTRTTQASRVQLEETGASTIGGDVTTSWVEGGVRRQMGYNDLLALSARATSTELTDAPGSQSIVATGTWTHRLNSRTELTPILQYETLSRDNTNGSSSDTSIWRAMLGFNSQLTKRLSLSAMVGGTMINVGPNGSAVALDTSLALPQSGGTAIDWIGNLQLSYRLTNVDTLSLVAAKTIGPDTFAVIREFETVGVAFSHRFNQSTTATLTADYSHQPGTNGTTDLYSTSATLNHQLAREWFTSASYRFRHRSAADGNADSHALYLSIRRDFTILGGGGGQPEPATRTDIGSLMAWPSAWIRPWRDATWWQRP